MQISFVMAKVKVRSFKIGMLGKNIEWTLILETFFPPLSFVELVCVQWWFMVV